MHREKEDMMTFQAEARLGGQVGGLDEGVQEMRQGHNKCPHQHARMRT